MAARVAGVLLALAAAAVLAAIAIGLLGSTQWVGPLPVRITGMGFTALLLGVIAVAVVRLLTRPVAPAWALGAALAMGALSLDGLVRRFSLGSPPSSIEATWLLSAVADVAFVAAGVAAIACLRRSELPRVGFDAAAVAITAGVVLLIGVHVLDGVSWFSGSDTGLGFDVRGPATALVAHVIGALAVASLAVAAFLVPRGALTGIALAVMSSSAAMAIYESWAYVGSSDGSTSTRMELTLRGGLHAAAFVAFALAALLTWPRTPDPVSDVGAPAAL